MNHTYVTSCTIWDYFGVLNVRNTVLKENNNSDFYFPSNSLEIMRYILFPGNIVCGIKCKKRLVAFSSLTVKYGIYEIQDTAVLPNYRGVGMQQAMWRYIISQIPDGRPLTCTIHPKNKHSLNNALSLGFKITERKYMYNSERYVLELKKSSKRTNSNF